jgi:hypothetical protein
MAKKSDKAIKPPVAGDDNGNLIRAGYAPTEMAKARKIFDAEIKERPEVMEGVTFSDFLFEQASMSYLIDMGLGQDTEE